jgi:transketolase
MIAITAADSGHAGGTLSIIDITTALYLKYIKHDPANPIWEDRDRVFWSARTFIYKDLSEVLKCKI